MLPRLIARMDIKGSDLIKPINLEGVRKIGAPKSFALDYYNQGIDEILYMDAVASLYNRNGLAQLVSETVRDIFVPITVGGGIRNLQDVESMLNSGADKVAINTAAIHSPELIDQVARRFGSQCMVLSIEAKRRSGQSGWEAYVDCGRERTNVDVVEWARQGVDRGAGEILLTSVDHEGMCQGLDVALSEAVSSKVSIPVILSGGMGTPQHMVEALINGKADAVAMAHVLHYKKLTVHELRLHLAENQISTRMTLAK